MIGILHILSIFTSNNLIERPILFDLDHLESLVCLIEFLDVKLSEIENGQHFGVLKFCL